MRYIGNSFGVLVCSVLLAVSSLVPTVAYAQNQNKIEPQEYYLEGLRHYNEGNWSTSRELFVLAIGADPANDAAYYYLGLSYIQLGDLQAAEAYLVKAQEKDPSNFWYKVKLAELYAQTNQVEKAITTYEGITRDHPQKHSVFYDIIDLYTASQQYDKALETLDKIESLKGENELTGEARYELLLRQGNYQGALTHLEDYYRKYPAPRVALILGDLNKSMYRDTLAIRYYHEALKMDPGFTPADFGLAEVYRTNVNFKEFFPHIYRFLGDPKMNVSIKTRYMKEVIITPHFVRQYMDKVDHMVNSIISAHPQDTSALYMGGAYFLQTGRDTTGKLLFKGAVEAYPEDHKANMEYISLLYYLKDWEELAIQTENTLHYFPEDKSFMEILPIAYWQSGDTDKAIEQYNTLIKNLTPKDTIAYTYYASLGDLYHDKGDSKKAYSYYRKALKHKPDYNPVLNNFAYYLCLEGKDLKKAAKMSLKTIESEPDNPTYLDTYAWILFQLGEYNEAKSHIKRAMFYGGNEDATLLDHYAEILFALKEYDLAFIYWEQADKKDPTLGIGKKIAERKGQLKK